jgi:hypothetical protein
MTQEAPVSSVLVAVNGLRKPLKIEFIAVLTVD